MTLDAGKELGHYKILRKLGTGGMADVYEAQDLKLGRNVALKILPPELMRNPEMVARFESEVRAAASLNHRSIVTVFEVGKHEGVHFYSMGLLTGGDLRRRIRAGALRAIDALAILRELCGAFEHAHSRGFVHRDVKPENVMFDGEGLPVLTDFGIAKALGSASQMTGTGVAIGTPRYFSPEQARGKPVDARSDLYSLGIIFYEMLTGKTPYDGEDALAIVMKHVNDPIPVLPDEHAHLQPLLELMMAKDPAHRIASARELRKQIAGAGGFASLTPQPINLGEESEMVQRLLSGESAAYHTPASGNPTVVTAAPKAGPGTATRLVPAAGRGTPNRGGQAYVVADDGSKAAPRQPPPPRKPQVEQIIPYRARATASEQPPASAGTGVLKPLAALVLAGVAAVAWLPALPVEVRDAVHWADWPDWAKALPTALELRLNPPEVAVPPPAAKAVPVRTHEPPPAAVEADAKPVVPAPAATAASQAAPVQKPATTAAEPAKPVPAKVPGKHEAAAPAPQQAAPKPGPATQQAAPRLEPAPQQSAPKLEPAPLQATPKPEPAPQQAVSPPAAPATERPPLEEPVAAKPKPAPAPASVTAEPPVQAEPEPAPDEDDFLRQRAEQLKLERERREAAKKKAAEEALRQQQQQQPQAPAAGDAPAPDEPAESPPPT